MAEEEVKVAVAEVEAPAKKKKKKWPIVLGTVVGVIAVLAVAFVVWHNQPSFCNAICHTPMDPYLPTYEATPGQASMDKWGNEVSDASAMMACTHAAEGITCMGCHVPTLSEQINEGIEWISGNYEVVSNPTYGVVLEERNLKTLVTARGITADEFCMNSDCHDVERGDSLVALTADLSASRNPHSMPHAQLQCSDCHKAHRASVNQCSQCHSDAPIPDGWLTVAEEKALAATAK